MQQTQMEKPSVQNPLKDNSGKIASLVRAGLLKSSELPQLKVALLRQQKVGDIARLSKAHRDIIAKYNSGLSSAAFGSQQAFQAVRRNLMNSVNVEQKETINEAPMVVKTPTVGTQAVDPPMMLVLKRKGVRLFPDGQRVAIYVNERLGMTFSVPYKTTNIPGVAPMVTSEEVEDVMENIDQVVSYATQEQPKSLAKHMKFADGSKLKVSHSAAKAIHMVYDKLNDDNKKKYADMLTAPKTFEKAANFALSKTKFTIGEK